MTVLSTREELVESIRQQELVLEMRQRMLVNIVNDREKYSSIANMDVIAENVKRAIADTECGLVLLRAHLENDFLPKRSNVIGRLFMNRRVFSA